MTKSHLHAVPRTYILRPGEYIVMGPEHRFGGEAHIHLDESARPDCILRLIREGGEGILRVLRGDQICDFQYSGENPYDEGDRIDPSFLPCGVEVQFNSFNSSIVVRRGDTFKGTLTVYSHFL